MSDAAASAAAEAEAADKEETGSMHSSDEEILSNPDKFRDPTLNTLEEVADAVERAKTTVIQFDGPHEEKKVLVQRLINLRIQEYVMHERAAGPPIGFELKGHKFIGWQEGKGDFPGIGNTKKIYCQVGPITESYYISGYVDNSPLGVRVQHLGDAPDDVSLLQGVRLRRPLRLRGQGDASVRGREGARQARLHHGDLP